MNKLNILEFSHQRELGGTDKHSQLMMQYYDREKFNVFAASYQGGARAQWINDNNIPNFISTDISSMIEWIKKQKIDIAHFYRGGNPEPVDIYILKQAGIPVLIEQNCFAKFDDTSDRAEIDIHLMCSNSSVNIYRSRAGNNFDDKKVKMIYCPIENDKFDKVKIDYSKPIFGRFSRKDTNKWHTININCLPYIRQAVPDAKFYVIGMPDEYKEGCRLIGVDDMLVEFDSPSDEGLLDFMSQITIFSHSALIGESFGNIIAESMSAGLPVVTHAGGDGAQAELVSNGYNGFISFNPNDEVSYANHIINLLKNPVLKERMGQLSKKRAKEWFDPKKILKQFEDLYIEQYKLKCG